MSTPAPILRPDSPRGRGRLGPSAYERALRLKMRRDALGLSTEDVARALGIERDRYVYWEKSWSDALAAEWGDPLAQVLQCEQGWLVFGLGDAPPSPAPRRNEEARVLVDVEVPSLDMRLVLAQRLRDRRLALRITPRQLAERARIPLYLVRRAEKELPERPLALTYARRWEEALGVPQGWIYDEKMALPQPNGGQPVFQLPAGASVATLVREVTRWLCTTAESRLVGKTCELEDNGERNAAILAARYGVHGEEEAILQAVGDRFALTRERVRQLQDKHLKRSSAGRFPMGPLDRLVEAVTPRLPATVKALDAEFRALLGEDLSIAGADRFAREFFGRSILNIEGGMTSPVARRGPIAVKKASDDNARSRAVREAAMKMISTCGAANIYWVVGSLMDSGKRAITVNEAKRLLPLVEGFAWLKERDGYFWFGPDPRNRVVDVATKVLAVAKQRIDVEDIQEAIARSRRVVTRDVEGARLNVELPLPILSALLSASPGIKTVQRNDYVLVERPELAQVLSNTELAVHRVLAARGGVADRKYLLDKLVRKRGGMTNISFQVALDQSAILRRLDYGLYALRGWPLDKAATGRAIAAAARNRRGGNTAPPVVVECLPQARFTIRVTPYNLANGVFNVPVKAGAQCGQGGEYRAGNKVVRLCGSVQCGYRMPGMVGVLKALGVKAGDSAVVTFDNVARTVHVELRASASS